jgi:hypothetical protein
MGKGFSVRIHDSGDRADVISAGGLFFRQHGDSGINSEKLLGIAAQHLPLLFVRKEFRLPNEVSGWAFAQGVREV